jgi:hypothetical protein
MWLKHKHIAETDSTLSVDETPKVSTSFLNCIHSVLTKKNSTSNVKNTQTRFNINVDFCYQFLSTVFHRAAPAVAVIATSSQGHGTQRDHVRHYRDSFNVQLQFY